MVEELALSFEMMCQYLYIFWIFVLLWFNSVDMQELLLA